MTAQNSSINPALPAKDTTYNPPSRLNMLLYGNRFRPGLLRLAITYIPLIILATLFLLPFYWMMNTALKPDGKIFAVPPEWTPDPVMWDNFYKAVTLSYVGTTNVGVQLPPMLRYAFNTALITANGVVATILSSSLVAYAFARLRFPGKNVFFLGILATLMIPFAVVMVPQFIIWNKLDWLNTFLPLMVPHWFGGAYNIFLLRQFFMGIPMDYDESAIIDGASHWQIFWKILMPLSKPALAAVGVFAFVFFWNDFLGPLIILTKPETFTLTMYLVNFTVPQMRTTPWNLYMAAAFIITLPCMILFFFTQNIFLRGISIVEFKR